MMRRQSAGRAICPASVVEELELPTLADALSYLHTPPANVDLESIESGTHPLPGAFGIRGTTGALHEPAAPAKSRQSRVRGTAGTRSSRCKEQFIESLPYELTGAQNRVVAEISNDLKEPHPMMRLIQGDVGSGKTVVAAAACAQAVASGVQAAVMAPTELLAEQHWTGFSEWFDAAGRRAYAWLSGSQKQAERRSLTGGHRFRPSAKIVIGTHALVPGRRRIFHTRDSS